ncbi:hypothetical protein QAD02_018658 [Eretmocerus hayati]|uniref:Uncharacterized protein n=1 Tax=Eretmocerus hayati TaxID=131215 RepID=A0ACC2PHE1_9HYME|nr:hypothetical protein QAD02_018658 [Eretmocerus hayati]
MSEPIVETCCGKVRGYVERNILGQDYYAFKGIPYAKPPVGELRFQDPVPAEPWDGIRDAKKFSQMCTQTDFFTKESIGSDDCLYLNVYAKHLEPHSKKPVMVWIHGGGFVNGDGSDETHGPDYLVRKDIVLVTINYRLGILGFLNLEDEVAPGNQGLKDQVLALQWVRDNIDNFGGNPDNVTIFGESAGGASVHYLAISPLAKGLFHKVISQSGVVFNPWTSIIDNPKRFAYRVCEIMGKKTENHQEIIDFFRNADGHALIKAQDKVLTLHEKVQFMFPFGPGIDAKSKNPFMPIHPVEAAQNGVEMPLLIGFTSREGILFYELWRNELPLFHQDFKSCIHPKVIELWKKYNKTTDDLRQFYFENSQIDEDNQAIIADFLGDIYFVDGIQRAIKVQLEKKLSPTYVYQYTYDRTPSPAKVILNSSLKGAAHADELQHLFRMKMIERFSVQPLREGTESFKLMEQIVDLWVNFAQTGNPTPPDSESASFEWQPVTDVSLLCYLNICEESRMEIMCNLDQRFVTIDPGKK